MTAFDEIACEIERRLNGSVEAEICCQATKYLLATPVERLEMLSYGTLYAALGKSYKSDEFVRAIQLLAGAWLNLLDVFFKFHDRESGREYDVENEDVYHAQSHGKFFHPVTGIELNGYEDDLIIYFCASERLRKLKSGIYV